MLRLTNLQHQTAIGDISGRPFANQFAQYLVSVDVEWTKNYKVKNGSRVFCYSIALLRTDALGEGSSVASCAARVGLKSAYAETEDEMVAVIKSLDDDLAALDASGAVFCGHQLISDISVVLACAPWADSVSRLRVLWTERRVSARVYDTRFDLPVTLLGDTKSRRLVDVATALNFDVTQPELRSGSMSALHRKFLGDQDQRIAQRLAILNLRHSLSTLMLSTIGLGYLKVPTTRWNSNVTLRDSLWDSVEYVNAAEFELLCAR